MSLMFIKITGCVKWRFRSLFNDRVMEVVGNADL